MKTPVLAMLALLLASCGDDRVASTEVDNHLTTVTGVVVDGTPLVGARVVVRSADGTTIAETSSDAAGRFALAAALSDSVLIVESDPLSAVVVRTQGIDTLRVSLNPVSSEMRRRLERAGGLRADRHVRDSIGDMVARTALGAAVPWDSLRLPARSSSPASLVLHRLHQRATTEGIPSVVWLERAETTGVALFTDPEERRSIAREAARSDMDRIEAETWLEGLDREHGDDSLAVRWFLFYNDPSTGIDTGDMFPDGLPRDSIEAMHDRLLDAFADSLRILIADSGDVPLLPLEDLVGLHGVTILQFIDPGEGIPLDSAQLVALRRLGMDLVAASVLLLRQLDPIAWGAAEELELHGAFLAEKVMGGIDYVELLGAEDPSAWLQRNRTSWPLSDGPDEVRSFAADRFLLLDPSLWR